LNIVSTNKLLLGIEFNDKNCDSILIDKLPNDDVMRIVVARGNHILSSDEIENEGKRITVNLEDMANCADIYAHGEIGSTNIANCVSVSGNQKMIED